MARKDQVKKDLEKLREDLEKSKIESQAHDLQNQQNRKLIISYIDEYVLTEPFMNKVKKHAREEFYSLLLKFFLWTGALVAAAFVGNRFFQ